MFRASHLRFVLFAFFKPLRSALLFSDEGKVRPAAAPLLGWGLGLIGLGLGAIAPSVLARAPEPPAAREQAAETASVPGAGLRTPEEFLGRSPGEDRFLATFDQVAEYMRLADAASDRVTVEVAGRSTLGEDILNVVLTSEANTARLDDYREISRRLANADRLAPEEADRLVEEGKAVALVTCTIHSTEVGCTQMAVEFVHEIATTRDPEILGWLEDVILLLVPSINPDGQNLVIDWYNRGLGTDHEGGSMPWLYHHYVGHDLNRDFFMLTQTETRAVNEIVYHRWFPQVFLDEHQMGSLGARMVVPPQTDPLAPEIHPLIFRQADLLGTAMTVRLEEAGKTGVGSNMIFDSYWPGGTRNTAWWKNVTGLLTEVASARLATPIYIEPGELRGGVKGLPEYQRRANFPSPWEGGWWRLRDILDYERIATYSFLESCSRYRESLLRNFYRMNREAADTGKNEAPYAFLVPPARGDEQHDPVAAAKLVELLMEHGVRVERATAPFTVGRAEFPEGTFIIPADQPYRPFLLTMLRPQRYPEVRAQEDGPILPPYDVTAWSLPLLMGVSIDEAPAPVTAETQALARGAAAGFVETAPGKPGAGPVSAEGTSAPGGYLLSHRADTAATAANRLLAAGKRLYWLPQAFAGGAVGDLYLPPGELSTEEAEELARELGVSAMPLPEAPEGSAWHLAPVKVGLYKPWVASMDEGWTRFLLEGYEFPYVNLENDRMTEGSYSGEVDVIVLPDVSAGLIERGARGFDGRGADLPEEYMDGVGSEGGERLRRWVVEEGGTLVALDSSSRYAVDLFSLPVEIQDDRENQVNAPGTLVRILLDPEHPLAWGMREEEAAYFARSPVFQTRLPEPRFERRVVARYPDDRRDVLVSGYLEGAENLARRAAVVEVKVGKGRVILIGFRAQHRAQPLRTFKLLFNALFLAGAEQTSLAAEAAR